MHTMDTMGYGPKKYRPPLSPTNFYPHDLYSRPSTLRPQSEYRFAGGGYPQSSRSSSRSSNLCSAALIGGALLAAVVVLAVAALAFYMGALKPDNGEPIMSFEGTLRVIRGDVYGGAPGSPAWRERQRRYSAALRQIFTGPSTLKQAFAGVLVTGFGDHRLDVYFRLYLDRRKIPSSMTNIEEILKDILLKDLVSKHSAFGQIKIDTTSIIIKRDLEHSYHSESYVKEALNETFISGNQKPLTPPSSKEKTLQTRVGVVRKTTIKPNESSKQISSDEPEIDTENLPVVQGSFQITKTEADITENKHNPSPIRNEEKISQKSTSTSKPRSTVKSIVTTTDKNILSKTTFTTTQKTRPFTMTSTLNVKTRTDPTVTKEGNKIVKSPVESTLAPSTTTIKALTNNVSQILFDLLTNNENHYKDLPKIDTLFTVPHVIDNEPWRPITKPYYDVTSETPSETYKVVSDQNAEDRIGIAEVVDDASILESFMSPIPPVKNRVKVTYRPEGLYHDSENNNHVSSPIYTSFTLPTFAPPIKNMETLGSVFPKPHPIPVDKISSVVETNGKNVDNDDDGKPVERPPKDKKTSITLNVIQIDQQGNDDNTTEKVSIDGASILKKNDKNSFISNLSPGLPTSTISTISNSLKTNLTVNYALQTNKNTSNLKEIVNNGLSTKHTNHNNISTLDHSLTMAESKETTTKRPNDKVSIIPNTNESGSKWELVSTLTKNNSYNKNTPEKFYNETLQAIITKNDVSNLNTSPIPIKKDSILRNLTEIIKKYSHISTEKPTNGTEENQNNPEVKGSVEVISEEELETTTPRIITLMPAKSNLGVNRPLRPRPSVKENQTSLESQRSFTDINPQVQNVLREISHGDKQELQKQHNITAHTIIPISKDSIKNYFPGVTEKDNIGEIEDNLSSSKRLPKASDDLSLNGDNIALESQDIKKENIPDGTYKVSYHITGSVSSKQANKTLSLPSYELPLETDFVLEIPINHTNTLTVDKLRQLASLATLSNANNTLLHSPGGIISTKAIPSSYTLNQSGFKILTKTYSKIPFAQFNDHWGNPRYDKNHIDTDVKKGEDCNNATSFRCASGACLPVTSRCNRLLDCPGGEDEKSCSCADYLRAEFSQSKICDGIVDCWDYSDENKCVWCAEGQYVCSNAKQCVETSRVCDGTPDCPLGDDEKSCVALGDDVDENNIVPYNDEGFLMVRKRGVWGRLCVESFSEVVEQAHSLLKLSDLGRAVCSAMTYRESPWAREAREGRKASTVGYWEVWHNSGARAADTRLTFRRSACARRRALRVRCQDLDCGIRPNVPRQEVLTPRVVGGGSAAEGSWPWQAALYKNGDFQCGGTLIHHQWLLSASHCFAKETESHWVARLGTLRRVAWPRGPWEHVARVRQIVIHPRYQTLGFRNDIALLRVDPLKMHARLRPACLPPSRLQPPVGLRCTVIGWGQLNEYERVFPDTLQEVELPVISAADCRRRTRLLPLYRVTDDMFCAGYENGGRDACLGDSGGPLMCQEADNKWYVYGVTSNGYGCARANRPGVYTKVSHYIEWINNVIISHTPQLNTSEISTEDTDQQEDFYSDLETSENGRLSRVDTCKGHRCPLGECLPVTSICNGFIECSDSSDEMNCSSSSLNTSSIDPD